jgi:hypothetical protein
MQLNPPRSLAASKEPEALHGENSKRAFRLVHHDALASEAMGTLTTHVFLVGFAVELGASNSATHSPVARSAAKP